MTYELVEKEIKRLLKAMSEMDPSSEEYQRATENLQRLCEIKLEKEKFDDEKKQTFWDTVAKHGIEAGAILLNLGFRMIWTRKGFRFEEHGNYLSTTYKWLIKEFFKSLRKGL